MPPSRPIPPIRRATRADVDALLELEEAAFDSDRINRAQWRRHIDSDTASVFVGGAHGSVDAAAVDLSTVQWMVKQDPNRYADPGVHWQHQLYGAALRQGDLDWLQFVNTVFDVAMFGNDTDEYDAAFEEFFGSKPPERHPGFPMI